MRSPEPAGSSPTRWDSAERCRASSTARPTRRCLRQAGLRTDLDFGRRCDLGRPRAVGLVRLAARLQVRDAVVQRARRLAIAELLVALNCAFPRRLRVVDLAQSPKSLRAAGQRLAALSCLVAGHQLKR